MGDKFKDIIKRKVDGFSIKPDVNDWLAIEQQLDISVKKKGKFTFLLPHYFAVAAVITTLIVVGSLFLKIDDNNINQDTLIVNEIEQEQVIIETDTQKLLSNNPSPQIINNIIREKKENLIAQIDNPEKEEVVVDPGKPPIVTDETYSLIENTKNPKKETDTNENSTDNVFMPLNKEKRKNLSIGLSFASNGYNSSSSGSAYQRPGAIASTAGFYLKKFAVETQAGSLSAHNADHHFPISFGLAVQKNISNKYAIKTGITYTYMRSVFTLNNNKQTQHLHYVGIPISGLITVKNFGRFSVYLSAGGMVEKNVAGKMVNKLNTSKYTGDKLQWSINAYAGLDFKLYKTLGLYIEPGWSYHFNNHELTNYYSKYPSSFAFQAGFRLGL